MRVSVAGWCALLFAVVAHAQSVTGPLHDAILARATGFLSDDRPIIVAEAVHKSIHFHGSHEKAVEENILHVQGDL